MLEQAWSIRLQHCKHQRKEECYCCQHYIILTSKLSKTCLPQPYALSANHHFNVQITNPEHLRLHPEKTNKKKLQHLEIIWIRGSCQVVLTSTVLACKSGIWDGFLWVKTWPTFRALCLWLSLRGNRGCHSGKMPQDFWLLVVVARVHPPKPPTNNKRGARGEWQLSLWVSEWVRSWIICQRSSRVSKAKCPSEAYVTSTISCARAASKVCPRARCQFAPTRHTKLTAKKTPQKISKKCALK